MNERQRIKRLYGYIIIAAFVVLIIVCAILTAALIRTKTALKADEEYISARNSRTYTYYGERDYVLVDDRSIGNMWLAPVENVPLHGLDFSNIRYDKNGYKYYEQDGECITRFGIDVSYHNGDIDWDKVKASGVEFVMIRTGYRGYDEGIVKPDVKFEEYIRGAAAAGLDIGVYFYSQAISEEEAEEEADYVLTVIDGYDITYPVVFDWEQPSEDSARAADIDIRTLNSCATVFCNRIARGGYIPMVYFNRPTGLMKFDLNVLAGFDMWLAEYRDEPVFPYRFAMWQYASDGNVDGIESNVDLDLCFVDYPAERR